MNNITLIDCRAGGTLVLHELAGKLKEGTLTLHKNDHINIILNSQASAAWDIERSPPPLLHHGSITEFGNEFIKWFLDNRKNIKKKLLKEYPEALANIKKNTILWDSGKTLNDLRDNWYGRLPRCIYGMYLKYIKSQAILYFSNAGIEVNQIRAKVNRIDERRDQSLAVYIDDGTEAGQKILTNHLISSGGFPPPKVHDSVKQNSGYFGGMYYAESKRKSSFHDLVSEIEDRYKVSNTAVKIHITGTGASAMDVIFYLHNHIQNHPSFLKKINISVIGKKDFVKPPAREGKAIFQPDFKSTYINHEDLLNDVKMNFLRAKAMKNTEEAQVRQFIRVASDEAARTLPQKEKEKLSGLNYFDHYHQHFAMEAAELVDAVSGLKKTGVLKVITGRVNDKSLTTEGKEIKFRYKQNGSDSTKEGVSEIFIQCGNHKSTWAAQAKNSWVSGALMKERFYPLSAYAQDFPNPNYKPLFLKVERQIPGMIERAKDIAHKICLSIQKNKHPNLLTTGTSFKQPSFKAYLENKRMREYPSNSIN